MFQEQLLEGRIGADGKEADAARLAEFAEALQEILNGLLITLEAEPDKGDFLIGAGLRINYSQIAKRAGREFLGREDLDHVYLKAAAEQRGEACVIAGRVEKITEDQR